MKYRPWRWYIDEELVKIFDDLMWFDDWDNQKYVKLGQLCSVEMQRIIFRRYFIIKLQCRYSTPLPKKKPRTQSYSWTFYFSLISVIFVVPGCFGVLSNFRLFELFLKDARFCCGISLYLTSVSTKFSYEMDRIALFRIIFWRNKIHFNKILLIFLYSRILFLINE